MDKGIRLLRLLKSYLRKKKDNMSSICSENIQKWKCIDILLFYVIQLIKASAWKLSKTYPVSSKLFNSFLTNLKVVTIYGMQTFSGSHVGIFWNHVWSSQHFTTLRGTTFLLSKRLRGVTQKPKQTALTIKAAHSFLESILTAIYLDN